MDFSQKLQELLMGINGSLASMYRNRFSPIGITKSQGMVIMFLADKGGELLMSELNVLPTPASNITNICNRLERNGFIHRKREQGDRRKIVISLTAKGIEATQGIRSTHAKIVEEVTNASQPSDRDTIIDGLEKLYKSILKITQ